MTAVTISQLNIQYDAIEDRLQLNVLSTDDAETRIWLTRRYVRLLLKELQQIRGDSLSEKQLWRQDQANVGSGQASTSEDANVSVANADVRFDDVYMATDDTHLPLGEEPILVARIGLRENDNGNLQLTLGQEHKGSMQMELDLPEDLVINLLKMLYKASAVAEWDLGLAPQNEVYAHDLSGAVLH